MNGRLSIIVPTLNEGALIGDLLQALQALRALGHEVIISDGGSGDDTCERAGPLVDRLVKGEPGRAVQMNRGAELATGELLWFLHADTRFSVPTSQLAGRVLEGSPAWGFCRVRLDASAQIYRVIEWFINQRSRLSRVGTGDQGLFVRRALFEQLGGFAPIPLMEDIELSKRLRRLRRPTVPELTLITSARRWQRQGIARTVLLMWRLRLAYFLGVSPSRLAAHYRLCSSPARES